MPFSLLLYSCGPVRPVSWTRRFRGEGQELVVAPCTVAVDRHLAIVREQLHTETCPALTQVTGVSATFRWGNAAIPTSRPDADLVHGSAQADSLWAPCRVPGR